MSSYDAQRTADENLTSHTATDSKPAPWVAVKDNGKTLQINAGRGNALARVVVVTGRGTVRVATDWESSSNNFINAASLSMTREQALALRDALTAALDA